MTGQPLSRHWRIDVSWICPGRGCRNEGPENPRHVPHFVARSRIFDTEDLAARWRLRAGQEDPGFSAPADAADVDIFGPYEVVRPHPAKDR